MTSPALTASPTLRSRDGSTGLGGAFCRRCTCLERRWIPGSYVVAQNDIVRRCLGRVGPSYLHSLTCA